MLCLDVRRNGKQVARAGVLRGSVSAWVNWRSEDGAAESLSQRAVVRGLSAWVSGFSTTDPQRREHVTWRRMRGFRLGDELTIKVVRSASVTRPVRREPVAKARHTKRGTLDRCSFCGRWRGDREIDAPSMVWRSTTGLCAQCVFLAGALIETKARRTLYLRTVGGSKCSFCGKAKSRLVAGAEARVCTACLKRFQRHF